MRRHHQPRWLSLSPFSMFDDFLHFLPAGYPDITWPHRLVLLNSYFIDPLQPSHNFEWIEC